MLVTIIGGAIILAGALGVTAAEPLPSCDQTQRFAYTSPQSRDLATKVGLEPGQATLGSIGQTPAVLSPRMTAGYHISHKPDFSKPGPWNTEVVIQGTTSHPLNLRLTVRDHGNNDVSLTWLNEHLLYVHIWWGRLVDGHLILDIDEGKTIHSEEGRYHAMVEPCE